MVLRLCVLASGNVVLDGAPVTVDELDAALRRAKEHKTTIWYYREAAQAEPPPQAMVVLQLVVKYQLPVSLSTKPDFSDFVDAQGISHPRPGMRRTFAPMPPASLPARMPDVTPRADIEAVFAQARKVAAGDTGRRGLVVVAPARQYVVMPLLPDSPTVRTMAANLSRFIPTTSMRHIVGIGCTSAALNGTPYAGDYQPDPQAAALSVAFFALLVGFAGIGHAVWAFEGHDSALEAGCRGADVLLVSSAVVPLLDSHWVERVSLVMRNANIIVHSGGMQLAAVCQVGRCARQLEFA